ncbi:MAG TPA: pilus assembly protein PilM [Clostridiales bacterium]|nr:pilus assembly protein PilM [Clostridiales bacterium]
MSFISLLKNNVISIDIGSFETKVVIGCKKKDQLIIDKAFSFKTPDSAYMNGYIKYNNVLVNKVTNEFVMNNVKSGICYLSIKSTDIITREITIPVIEKKDIDGLLKYQLAEYLPMDYSKYVIQHRIINKFIEEGKEKLNISVIAAPADMVDMHYNFVRDIGLRPVVLDYQPNCIWKLFCFSNGINGKIKIEDKTIAAIDLGHDSTNVTIIKEGIMKINRVIDMEDIKISSKTKELTIEKSSESEDIGNLCDKFSFYNGNINNIRTSLESILNRIDRMFKFFLSNDIGCGIDYIILYGGLSKINEIDKLFFDYFGIPTMILNRIEKLNTLVDINKYINCLGLLIRNDGV